MRKSHSLLLFLFSIATTETPHLSITCVGPIYLARDEVTLAHLNSLAGEGNRHTHSGHDE